MTDAPQGTVVVLMRRVGGMDRLIHVFRNMDHVRRYMQHVSFECSTFNGNTPLNYTSANGDFTVLTVDVVDDPDEVYNNEELQRILTQLPTDDALFIQGLIEAARTPSAPPLAFPQHHDEPATRDRTQYDAID